MQYPMIAQPQYGFAPTMPMMPSMSDMPPAMMNFKKGGDVKQTYGLENAAEQLRRRGRGGDTILAHINPEEAGILQLLGGSGTINPYTGLPEFFLKKLFDAAGKGVKSVGDTVGKVVKGTADELGRAANSIAEALGPVGQIAAAYFGGPIGAAVYAGFAAPGQRFDVKQAAKAGALTYGAGQLSQAMGGAGGGYDVPDGGGGFDLGYTPGAEEAGIASLSANQVSALQPVSPSVTNAVPTPAEINAIGPSTAPGPSGVPISSSGSVVAPPTSSSVFDISRAGAPAPIVDASNVSSSLPSAATSATSGVGSLAGELGSMALNAVTPTSALDALKIASTAATAYGSIKSLQELERQKEEAEKIMREQEKRTAEDVAFAKDVLAKYPMEYRRLTEEDVIAQQNMAGGGLAGLNAFKAGGRPRFLKGGGDGMSDDIPATIGGRQKAALSDGEFVIPADVVSHLGNGSSRAGAKKLYSMMDKIRQDRTGKKRQAPQVNADRYMPA